MYGIRCAHSLTSVHTIVLCYTSSLWGPGQQMPVAAYSHCCGSCGMAVSHWVPSGRVHVLCTTVQWHRVLQLHGTAACQPIWPWLLALGSVTLYTVGTTKFNSVVQAEPGPCKSWLSTPPNTWRPCHTVIRCSSLSPLAGRLRPVLFDDHAAG